MKLLALLIISIVTTYYWKGVMIGTDISVTLLVIISLVTFVCSLFYNRIRKELYFILLTITNYTLAILSGHFLLREKDYYIGGGVLLWLLLSLIFVCLRAYRKCDEVKVLKL